VGGEAQGISCSLQRAVGVRIPMAQVRQQPRGAAQLTRVTAGL
jgi:hypothetical protein